MGRMSIIIVDNDIEYLANLEKFLLVNYPQRFELFTFSSADKLTDFFKHKQSIDILIISSQIYRKDMKTVKAELSLILLEDSNFRAPKAGVLSPNCERLSAEGERQSAEVTGVIETIYKYQHMDKLVSEIIRLYSEKSLKNISITGQGNTRVVGVYSPSGGTGSSSIAAGCSILCAGRGVRSFYLNMEVIPSTDLFFNGDCARTFSNVIFHLKGKGDNLQLKLEGAKCVDTKSGVHYFKPPESILELNELTDLEIEYLVSGLKNSAVYDYVFIDMSSGLNSFNTAILPLADVILLVIDQDRRTMIKLEKFRAGLNLLEHKSGIGIANRIIPVLNRFDGRSEAVKQIAHLKGCRPMIALGDCSRPEAADAGTAAIAGIVTSPVENKAFLTGLNSIMENFSFCSSVNKVIPNGGENIA